MSASREKKKRQDFVASGAADAKAAREAEKKAAEKKANILYSCIAALFVVAALGLVTYNVLESGVFDRYKTAITIDGEKYSVADTAYYYTDAYQSFMTKNSTMASMMGLDTSTPLSEQAFMGAEDMTWADYFREEAFATMRFVHAGKTAAAAKGITLDDADYATLESSKTALTAEAASYGYTYDEYIKAIYGNLVTAKLYEENTKDYLLATKYANQYYQTLSFTDDEILAYRDANIDNYEIVDAEYVVVTGVPDSKTDENGNLVSATEEEKAAAMAVAKEAADSILAAYKSGTSLSEAAEAYDIASYISNSSMPLTNTDIGAWMFDASRKVGDTDIVTTTSSYYVAAFHGRKLNDALEYNARHILITADSLGLAEGVEATDELLLAKAENVLASWDGTENGFANLAIEHSQDTGSAAVGGLYENVPKGYMVSQFEDWCYAEGRQAGDTGIVKTTYGYHIMYFVGYGDTPYWHYACNNQMISDAYTTWETDLITSVTAELNEKNVMLVG